MSFYTFYLTLWQLLLRGVKAGSLRGLRLYEFPNVDGSERYPHFTFFTDRNAAWYTSVRQAVEDAARDNSNREIAFVEISTQHPQAWKFFNLHVEQSEQLPLFMIVNWTHGMGSRPYIKHLVSRGEARNVTPALLGDAMAGYLDHKLSPWVRSLKTIDEPSTFDARRGAMEVVGTQFQNLVMDTTQDVLMMFYAPWCGFSKRMQPLFDAVAREVAHATDVVSVFKIDATENDVDHDILTELHGYPFLAFFPAGSKSQAQVFEVEAELDNPAQWKRAALEKLRQVMSRPLPDKPSNATELDGDSGLLGLNEEEF
eukprot:TRINITY_DN108202_c0_g1_i1.p1 TRINITY_DN108202_c0_g1~~TRINITY_DN108202_c0_g1_i1.p1  ORF type:complete len:313 (+),score=26.86 TRINITY_DN108202_c0_g1_i1:89-1027(+)